MTILVCVVASRIWVSKARLAHTTESDFWGEVHLAPTVLLAHHAEVL